MKKFNFKTLLLAIGLVVASVQPAWATWYVMGDFVGGWDYKNPQAGTMNSNNEITFYDKAPGTYYFCISDGNSRSGYDCIESTSGCVTTGNNGKDAMWVKCEIQSDITIKVTNTTTWKCSVNGVPSMKFKYNWNSNGWNWCGDMTYNSGDKTYSVISDNGYNSAATGFNWSYTKSDENWTTTIDKYGSPATGEKCMFTLVPNGQNAYKLKISKCKSVGKTSHVYFDNSQAQWNTTVIQLVVGNDIESKTFTMTKLGTSNMYYTTIDVDWTDVTYYALIGNSASWDSGKWSSSNISNATKKSAIYYDSYNLSNNITTLITLPGDDQAMTLTYQADGYGALNKAQTVSIMKSTNGGTSYSVSASWLGTLQASRYSLSNNGTGSVTTKELSSSAIYASGLQTSSITFTEKTTNTGYTFMGFNSTNGQPSSTSYTYTVNGEKTIYAFYKLTDYTYSYSTTPQNCTYSSAGTAHYNDDVQLTITPNDGYVVTSVTSPQTTINCSENVYSFKMPASDVSITVVTSLSKVNVTSGVHSSGHGEISVFPIPVEGKVDAGSDVTFTADPDDGYKVVGFYSDALCSNENLLQAGTTEGSNETYIIEKISAAATVYVKFTPITYTYTFVENGGTAQTDGTYNIESENITLPTSAEISRTGYDFAGWFDNSGFSGDAITTLTTGNWGNKTYYAKWTAHTYSVHFDANSTEGIAGSMEDQIGFTYDVSKPLTACNFTKQGYTFAGWNTKADGTGTNYSNSASVKNLTAENNATVTLYAKWNKANFTLSLTSDQQDGNLIHQIQKGSAIPITLTASATLNDNPYTLDLSHFDYTYKLVGSDGEPTPISTQTTNSTTWSAPTEVGHYTLTVSYNDGTITNKSASIDFVVWDEYTFYVWETGQDLNTADQNANKVHVYHKINSTDEQADYSETTWSESGLRNLTDLSAQWGGGWHSFTIKYPLYNFFIIGYKAYEDNQYQSNAYYLSKEPSAKDTYLRCYYNGSNKWTWGGASIAEPAKPTIEITEVKTYSSIIKVTIKYNPHYSHITEHSLTINGQEKTLDGFDDTDEKEYTLTLTDLTARTDYNFVASARNAIDNEEVSKTITTPAANKVRITARKAKNHPWTAMGFYAWSSATEGKLFNDMSDYNLSGVESGDYWVYTFELPDSPAKFYLTNGSSTTGMNRTQDIETTTDVCVTVIEGDWGGNRGYNHNSYCGAHYQLSFTNNSGVTTYSNIIDSPDDIMSLYVGKTGDGTLKLRHYDAAKDEIVDYITTGFTLPASANVYNVSLKDVSDFDNITIANLGDFVPYIGQYYIRTDAATGGWQEYLFADKDNAMTEFTPRRDKGEDYSYYWVKNVAKNGTVRVSACIGNEFNPDLANMLTYDDFVRKGDDNHGYIDKLDGVGANVRFSYEPTTNEFKRAVIGGSSANNFLNVYSNDENLYATKNGETLEDLLNDLQKEAAISRFNDVSDWVYEKVVYVKVVNEQSAANVILQSKFNSQTNYLLGYETDGISPKTLEVLGTGTNPDTYTIRITYDYKKNRLMASWEPGSMAISASQSINTDILFIQREDVNGAIDNVNVAQITYTETGITNDAKLTSLKNIIYVLEVTPTVMSNVAIDNQEYWITLPFNCRVSDVFGVEDYVKLNANGDAISGTWGIMRYDGKTRAEHGWFLDDYSTFWRWMTRDEIMNAGEGYVVIFDKTHANSWPSINVDGVNKQVKRLYFPSMNTGFTVSYSNVDSKVTYTNNPCTVEKRGDQDSNWKVLGPVSYNNIGVDNTKPNNLTFYYTYTQSAPQGSRYSEKQTITESNVFKSFHSFMTQFGGDLYWKPFTKSEDAATLRAPLYTENSEFQGGLLTIELNDAQGNELNHTFINLSKNGTTGFDRNLDLMKITENCAQIASVSEDVLYAGNTLPLDIETIPLNVKVVANGTYDIALAQSLEGLEVRLYDAFEQTTTPLDMMPATVTLDKGEYKDRFFLQFVQKSPLTPTNFNGTIEQFNLPSDKTQKLLINDQIYLINGGRIYNASGTQVK